MSEDTRNDVKTKPDGTAAELSEREQNQVAGGKEPILSEIVVTKPVDIASPKL